MQRNEFYGRAANIFTAYTGIVKTAFFGLCSCIALKNFLILSLNGQTMEQIMPNQADNFVELQIDRLAKGSSLLAVITNTVASKVIRALKQ